MALLLLKGSVVVSLWLLVTLSACAPAAPPTRPATSQDNPNNTRYDTPKPQEHSMTNGVTCITHRDTMWCYK